MIDSAVDQYAIETNRKTGDVVKIADWTNYLKKGSLLYNNGKGLLGTAYGDQTVDTIPQVPGSDLAELSDVANTDLCSPHDPQTQLCTHDGSALFKRKGRSSLFLNPRMRASTPPVTLNDIRRK